MKTQLIIFALGTALFILGSGCASSDVHRWQISQMTMGSSTNSYNQPVLLDTQTGETWIYVWYPQNSFWTPVHVMNPESMYQQR